MKIALSFLLVTFLATSWVMGQIEKSPTAKFLSKRGYVFPGGDKSKQKSATRWPDTLYYNTSYKAALFGSPTIPFTLTRLELVGDRYNITPTLSIGYGYTWFFGRFIFSENDKIIVDPSVFFGVIADIGLQNNFNLRQKPTGFFVGGFIGTQAFSIFSGYEFKSHSTSIGLGSRIDVYTLRQKSLRPFGRVREVRRHKRIATPIDDE